MEKINKLDEVINLCKRRGIITLSSEIYGGIQALWDFGPLGVELKNNIKKYWWKSIVQEREDVVGIETSILMHPKVWEASGHTKHFFDELVDCKSCKKRYRKDHINTNTCPECNGELTPPRNFNLMLETHLGPVKEDSTKSYLRPETAQGMFCNFINIINTQRVKIPFGIAQIGKAFRNEISPGHFIFRSREFDQMELEYFTPEEAADYYFNYWLNERLEWYKKLGINSENLRLREHQKDELAHYAKVCYDIEYKFPFGWAELEGIANRGQFDLTVHQQYSYKDLTYYDAEKKQRYIPYCIETSAGVERTLFALLCDALYEDIVEDERRLILALSPKVAPIKVAIFPLLKKDRLPEIARQIHDMLMKYFLVTYDEVGSIGRRYRRQDEIGTPYCITVDFQTLNDNTVTIRFRNSMKQERYEIVRLKEILMDWIENS